MMTYEHAHRQVFHKRGKANSCVWGCQSKLYHWANLTGDYENIEDYASMCVSCHQLFDNSVAKTEGNTVAYIQRTTEIPSDQIAHYLTMQILSGELKQGERLPSVSDLTTIFRVARATAVKALKKVETEGYITIIPNWGSFVA